MKECPKCGHIKPLYDFCDSLLPTGTGRICEACKKIEHRPKVYERPVVGPPQLTESRLTLKEARRLGAFIQNPENYAKNTETARQKVQYLKEISYKFTSIQKVDFERAIKVYNKTMMDCISKDTYGVPSCPKCSSKMVLRSGEYGQFYGCSRYPHCKGTRQSLM